MRDNRQDGAPVRYQYGADYLGDPATLLARIRKKTILPHQIEWQPGPPVGAKICWLECPYCYGGSATLSPERLPRDRALTVMNEMLAGGIRKFIFAGYATDPLFSPELDPILTLAIYFGGVTVGFNTKALVVPQYLIRLLSQGRARITPQSYVQVSVDAGSNPIYNQVHGVAKADSGLYDRVRRNIELLAWTGVEVAATYLVNRLNADEEEMERFVVHMLDAGVKVIRFAFAQLPRGATAMPTVPTAEECRVYADRVRRLVEIWQGHGATIFLANADADHDLFRKPRTLPCVARFVYPTVGYDGWLYHCSQSASPDFRRMALGDLSRRGFWDLYYDYDPDALDVLFQTGSTLMCLCDCRCDRKEHLVNLSAARMGGSPSPVSEPLHFAESDPG